MTTEGLFAQPTSGSNVPDLKVSELANALKRTLEDTFGHVRVRGELSGIKLATSGHLYGDLKDEDACINIVCWRGTVGRLSVKPADGLDVVITGRVTSYPKNSRYQIVVEAMELAGQGALLKMLEDRRKKLAAEGLFDVSRKKPLPFLPEVIGVVTSPTGAVIQDILHRLKDRFPRHVLVWPVAVQGAGAAEQIAAAIAGFNALVPGGSPPRPDIIIVARGGGSLEDLMAFNEESVVRAAAASAIPLISAVGHETDTTLIDYASDLRAPTPTGAAEMAVPVRVQLIAQLDDGARRLLRGGFRRIEELENRLAALAAKLGDPAHLMEIKAQTLDFLFEKLRNNHQRTLQRKETALSRLAGMLRHPRSRIEEQERLLLRVAQGLGRSINAILKDTDKRLSHNGRMLDTLSFERVLERGFAVVRSPDGHVVSSAEQAREHDDVMLQFQGQQKVPAKIGKKV